MDRLHKLFGAIYSRLSPVLPRHIVTLAQEQETMRRRVEDQEQRLRGLKAELKVIRRDVDDLIGQEDKP
jgi:hypothetical protein